MSTRFAQWASLSPWSIVSFSVGSLRQLLTNGYALIPLVYTGWQRGFNSPWLLLVAAGLVLVTLTYASLQWAKYRYRLSDAKLGIRQGLVFKRAQEIPLNKIQNVRLEQPLYFRPLGLYSLVVETAGSKQDEAVLAAVNYRQAMQLKKHLFASQSQLQGTETIYPDGKTPSLASEPQQAGMTANRASEQSRRQGEGLVVAKDLKDLLIFGFYQNNLIWLSIISGSIIGQVDWESLGQTSMVQGAWHWYQTNIATGLIYQILAVVAALLLLYLLLALISIASAVLKYYPYRLSLRQGTLHRTGGILAKQQDALRLHRVQMVRFEQPVIGRLIGRWTVHFEQVKGNEVEQLAKRHLLIPSMRREDIPNAFGRFDSLAAKANSLPSSYQGINSGWLWRRAIPLALLPVVMTLILGLNPFTELVAGFTLVALVGLYLNYRQWGYRLEGDDCWIHTGVLGQTWQLVPLSKTQDVCISQTPGQRRNALATLNLGLASGPLVIPYIPLEEARLIAETALSLTREDPKNWI
ncbi:PH domain-containing protein [Shewanella rhizosphaerae]|uniref:PH domain-containing protein n=1 Tax=Shewanella rhizosphaerae TaxID=2864207 RepID=UPI001C65FC80|nr:PH domain-containing protein [Shewanella rhizosphaerae]QYK12230.1 PH domain-containing protein [Shewanella rhizosphaerae]